MIIYDVATVAANLEANFTDIVNIGASKKWEEYTILDVESFSEGNVKAITLRDSNDNIFVHFNGTGSGNWGYNSAAYGEASPLQEWSTKYFDSMYKKYYDGLNSGSLYISGHSQGGNSAQYVTISSIYADQITNCISLDGPGFSTQVVKECKTLYGEEYYERQRSKIYAYNGENDYVSCLGQEQIVPEGQITYVQTPQKDAGDSVLFMYHDVNWLLNGNELNATGTEGDFRLFIIQFNKEILKLPQEQQVRAAELMMKVVENKLGSGDTMTEQELAEFKENLIPVLVDTLANNQDMVALVLEAFGLDPAVAALAEYITGQFNTLSVEERKEAFEYLSKILVIKDGKIEIDSLEFLAEFAVDHPVVTTVAIVALAMLSPFILAAIVIYGIVDKIIDIVQGIINMASSVKDFIINCVQAIKDTLAKLSEFLRGISAGGRYANSNPYFKVDTSKLRTYATRINNVNKRLHNLDGDLRGLYLQVGLLDIWDILVANLLTSGSPTLNQVKLYLSNAADRFETAESKARGNMGG